MTDITIIGSGNMARAIGNPRGGRRPYGPGPGPYAGERRQARC